MSEFTKGPWRVDTSELGGGPWILTDADDRGAREIAWSDADYRLIAAAPEMFALLAYFATYQCKHSQDPGQCPYCGARALIARIEPFGPHTHAGVWISRETADEISRDGA